MRRFVRTSVPAEGYEEMQRLGSRWLVHLEGTPVEGGLIECYECMTTEEPDITELTAELQTWKAYVAERELAVAKMVKKQALMEYDSSSAIDNFEIRRDGRKITDYWIDWKLRPSLEGDVKAAKEVGTTYDFDIRELGITLTLDCEKFLTALEVLRRYAYTAYNVTSRHLAAIDALVTKEAVESYDFTTDYPDKLIFNLEELI